ncbi:MAG: oxidoreductase [Parcubacteria group bacterium]|nr:oxidoreductase [Parcubacteria group bacterium]
MTNIDPKEKYPKPGKDEKPQEYPGLEAEMVTKPEYGKDTYKGSGKLEGKVALVTGGDSGIGRAVATAFAKEGADVLISYLPAEDADAQETIRVIEASGRKAFGVPADLRDEASCELLITRVVKEFGKMDILVNNAGLQRYFKTLDEITAQDFEEIYRVNVIAPFLLSKAASKQMKPGSAIVNTVSIEAYEPDFLLLPYASSKGAFVALTKGLAEELIKKGIRVNAVAPGPIWSPLNTHGSPPEKLQKFGEDSSFGRPGQPIELAPVYVLLASDEASYITGEIYGVTGGEGIA